MKRIIGWLTATWFNRLVSLIGVVAVLGFAVIVATMTPRDRSNLGLDVAGRVGFILPAIILGAAWGWVSLSRTQWMWATAIFLVGTFAVAYKGGPLNDAYKKADAEATTTVVSPTRAPYAAHYDQIKP
jgi:hypothetical protein